jgi:hypothetical protein
MIKIKQLKFFHMAAAVILLLLINMSVDAGAYEMKSNKQNNVRVDVRPVQLLSGKPAKFEIRMNTHSGDLNQDLLAVCKLEDNNGREYQARSWDGSTPGGHHRSGVLEFSELGEGVKSITLVIREVANVPERAFNWSVER